MTRHNFNKISEFCIGKSDKFDKIFVKLKMIKTEKIVQDNFTQIGNPQNYRDMWKIVQEN